MRKESIRKVHDSISALQQSNQFFEASQFTSIGDGNENRDSLQSTDSLIYYFVSKYSH